MKRFLAILLLALALPAGAQAPPPGLVFAGKPAFTEQQKAALTQLWALFPPRARTARLYVTQVPASAWRYGQWRGWTDESGNIYLKEAEWLGVRGLGLHELGHAYHYIFLTPAEWAEWEAFWAKHSGECGTKYVRVAKNANEGLSELLVCILKPGLPGYSSPSPAALAEGRRLLH